MSPIIRSVLKPFFIVLLLDCSLAGWAQGTSYPYKVAQDRMIWHDKVDQAQQRLIGLGGSKDDSVIRLTKDETIRSMTSNSKLNSTLPLIPMEKSDICEDWKVSSTDSARLTRRKRSIPPSVLTWCRPS
jgi:hypothetical protein